MANIIAIIWDFDKTLINGYMEEPIFAKFNVNSREFWAEVNALPEKYLQEQNVKVNPDTIYIFTRRENASCNKNFINFRQY